MVIPPNFSPDTIIWSTDVDYDVLLTVAKRRIFPVGTSFKLDRAFFEENGKDIITYLQEELGYRVFVDGKIIEIPDKVIRIAESYLKYKPWMLNVMADICSTGLMESDNPKEIDALKRYADACASVGTRSCGVTVLTCKTEKMTKLEFNKTHIEQVLFYVGLMHEAGFTDIVCSPLEVESIRQIAEYKDLCINTPGVRMPGSSKDDQARVATPLEALENGANRLVIGRDLIRGGDDIITNIENNYARIIEHITPYYCQS